jgi:hypothetical protein
MMGIAAGALFILAAVNLARPVMVAVCGIAFCRRSASRCSHPI